MTVDHEAAQRRNIRFLSACKTHGRSNYTKQFLQELFLRHGSVADAVFDAVTPGRIDTTSVAPVVPFNRTPHGGAA